MPYALSGPRIYYERRGAGERMSVDEVRSKLPCPLKITENSGEGFWRAISGQL